MFSVWVIMALTTWRIVPNSFFLSASLFPLSGSPQTNGKAIQIPQKSILAKTPNWVKDKPTKHYQNGCQLFHKEKIKPHNPLSNSHSVMADALLDSTPFKCILLHHTQPPSLPPHTFLSVQILALGCCVALLMYCVSHCFLWPERHFLLE